MAAIEFHPGKIVVDSVKISSTQSAADVTDLFVEFALDSSIVDYTAVGQLMLLDSTNFISKFPVEPSNRVEIKISYSDMQKTFSMRVVSIDAINSDDKQRAYVLKLVSDFAYNSYFTDVNRALTGTTSEIAKGIFLENSNEQINIWEQSSSTQKVVIPKWDPAYTVSWLARRSLWKNDAVRFYFFQDSNLKYNFMPIELAKYTYDEPIFTYNHNYDTTTIGNNQIPNSKAVMQAVKEVSLDNSFNLPQFISSGGMGGVRYAPDIVNKKYNPIGFNYHENFNKKRYLNNYPQLSYTEFEEAGATVNQYDIVTSFTHDGIGGVNKVSDISNIRHTNIDNMQNLKIIVVGNQVIDVGQVINFNISSPEPKSKSQTDVKDLRWSGKYYVTSKKDIFKRDVHEMALGISKESQIGIL